MTPVSQIAQILLGASGWTQQQVETLRNKINELATAVNDSYHASVSTAMKVLSGELGNAPSLPQGMTRFTFTAAATPYEVSHGLDRVPTGYLVIRSYPAGNVADASLDQWNAKTAWLQSDSAGLTVTLLFF